MGCKCKDCDKQYASDLNMVMLNDYLWEEICDDFEDTICADCIEKRMCRLLEREDLIPDIYVNNQYIDHVISKRK